MTALARADIDEVLRLDRAESYQDILALLLRRSHDAEPILETIVLLMRADRFAAAEYLGDALLRVGVDHPVAHLARAMGAMLRSYSTMEADSVAAMARHHDAMTAEQRAAFHRDIFHPVFYRMLDFAHYADHNMVLLRLLDILKAWAPVFRDIFDWSAAPAAPRDHRDGRPSPIAYRSPPAELGRTPYRVVVAMRSHFLTPLASTSLLDIGPRFVQAARAYGWPAVLCTMYLADLVVDLGAVLDACHRFVADILILDDDFIADPRTHPFRRQMIATLRQSRPAIKVVSLHLDSWRIPADCLRRAADDVDAIWATTPSLPVWRDPVFAGKMLHAPLVHAGHVRAPAATPPARASFVGAMLGYNWPRIFWRAAAIRYMLPIDWHLSYHVPDGLAPLDSYADYMNRLPAAGCALNLAMRDDLSCVITDRSFEAMLTGSLLIQEAADDLDHFFVAGAHYLPFRRFADLRAACQILAHDPRTAETIRDAGHAFAVARYADDKLIGYLDALLFHPREDQASGSKATRIASAPAV